jgi:CRP/FNR family cyclic AMP-dependent transcriptional regulator
MSWIEALGYLGALLTIGTYSMKTMIPLRVTGICANSIFIAYGILAPAYPQLFLHSIIRLVQMVRLVNKVESAAKGDLSVEWLKPFMTRRMAKRGEMLFRRGEPSTAMFYTVTGRYRLIEIRLDLGPGELVGEIGLIEPDNRRTQTLECIEDGELLSITYQHVKQLYFQNPKFGFHLLQLISHRLFQDIERLEERLSRAT